MSGTFEGRNLTKADKKMKPLEIIFDENYIEIKTQLRKYYISINPLMHNVPNGQTHFENLAAFAARFLKCLTILGHYALKS